MGRITSQFGTVVRLSDPKEKARWEAEGPQKALPNKFKRANNKLMSQPNTNPLTLTKRDFELGPRLKSISLNTDEHIIWPGAMREGYGVKKMGKTTINAHRYVYETATGKKIPKGWHIDHKCRERRCINPKHLEPVSPGENKRRAWQSKYFREGNHDKVTDKEVSKSGKLKIGTGVVAGVGGGVYGSQVTRGARAVDIDRSISSEDARKHNIAADKWVKEEKGKKRFKAKYYDKSRKDFAEKNPTSKKLRPTVRHWEDSYREVQRIRDAKPIEQSTKNIVLHPIKTRRYSDKKVLTRLADNGTTSDKMYRTMTLDKKPNKHHEFTPLSSWTPDKDVANKFATHQEKFNKLGIQRWNNAPKKLGSEAKPYVLRTEKPVRSANIAPLSRFGNVDERITSTKKIPVSVVDKSQNGQTLTSSAINTATTAAAAPIKRKLKPISELATKKVFSPTTAARKGSV